MNYWHDYSLRFPLREVAAIYPKTYQKVGEQLRELGLTSDEKVGKNPKKLSKSNGSQLWQQCPHMFNHIKVWEIQRHGLNKIGLQYSQQSKGRWRDERSTYHVSLFFR